MSRANQRGPARAHLSERFGAYRTLRAFLRPQSSVIIDGSVDVPSPIWPCWPELVHASRLVSN
jgi:hypothetical protein